MRELFPFKKPGDSLEAEHVNNLSEVARRSSGQFSGTNLAGINGPFQGQVAFPAFQQHQVIVTEITSATLYKVRYRYYDHQASEWKTKEDSNEFVLDSSEAGSAFAVDQKVTAYWHGQRRAFIPLAGQGVVLKRGKATTTVQPGATATIIVYNSAGQATEERLEDVRHDWITSGYAIQPSHELFIGLFSDEGVWRIIGAPCPSDGS